MDIAAISNSDLQNYQSISSAGGSKSEMMKLATMTKDDSEEGLEVAAREFTGMFIGQLLKEMRSTVELGDLGHGGQAEETFQSMVDDELANKIAYNGDIESGGSGLLNTVYNSLKQRAVTKAYNQAAQEFGN